MRAQQKIFINTKNNMSAVLTNDEIEILEICGKEMGIDILTEFTCEEQQIFLEHTTNMLIHNFEGYKDMDIETAELKLKKLYTDYKIYRVTAGTFRNSIYDPNRIVIVHKDGIVIKVSIG